MTSANLADFIGQPESELISRLGWVLSEISSAHLELAHVRAEERRQKVRGYMTSDATTHSGRERAADALALDATTACFEVAGRLAALDAERDFLEYLLDR